MITYIVEDDVVGGYAIGCDEEEMFWRGCSVDVADLALGKQLEIGDVRIDQGCSHKFEIFCIASGTSSVPGVDASRFGLRKGKKKMKTHGSYVNLRVFYCVALDLKSSSLRYFSAPTQAAGSGNR